MKKILIIEDEVPLREVYATLFMLEKYQVAEASNGREGLAELKKTVPDVVIVDVLMPVMGGLEFLEKARLKSQHPSLKVLVLSNLSDPSTLTRIDQLGATKYMLKASLSPAELVQTVNELVER